MGDLFAKGFSVVKEFSQTFKNVAQNVASKEFEVERQRPGEMPYLDISYPNSGVFRVLY